MQSLRRALVLPVLFCGIEGILWYWGIHSGGWVPSQFGIEVSPAGRISTGLDFPAHLWVVLTEESLLYVLPGLDLLGGLHVYESFSNWLLGVPTQLYFVLSVGGSWYMIGRWLDRRGTAKGQPEPMWRQLWRATWRLLVFGFGGSALLFSLYMRKRVLSFFDTIEVAMIQTWAVFLIGVPVSGLVRRLLERREDEMPSVGEPLARQQFSNFRLFVILLGVFAVLLILGVLTAPAGLK